MLAAAAKPFVNLVEKYLPDPFVFVLALTFVVIGAAVMLQQQPVTLVLTYWGTGFWSLLTFSMQMLLVLVSGHMLASTAIVKSALNGIARLAASPGKAILLVTLVSMLASWLNWGFGLVVGALFAKAIARRVKVDYRLLVASAYSSFVVWHGGLAGSIPLTIATPGHFTEDLIGIVDTSETLFSRLNLILLALMIVILPIVNRAMMPAEADRVYVDPELLDEPDSSTPSTAIRPAEKLERHPLLAQFVGLAGIAYLGMYFIEGGRST